MSGKPVIKRCKDEFSLNVSMLLEKLARRIVEGELGIRCKYSPTCEYMNPEPGTKPETWQKIQIMLGKHLLTHTIRPVYFCKVCDIGVRSLDHMRLRHRGKFISDYLFERFEEFEDEIVATFHKCFPILKYLDQELNMMLIAPAPRVEPEEEVVPHKLIKRLQRVGNFREELPKLVISEGQPARYVSKIISQEMNKVFIKNAKTLLNESRTIRCKFGSGCKEEYALTTKDPDRNHFRNCIKKLYIHVLRHQSETLYYCKRCPLWVNIGDYHQHHSHIGEKASDMILDFFDSRKEDLTSFAVKCFPQLLGLKPISFNEASGDDYPVQSNSSQEIKEEKPDLTAIPLDNFDPKLGTAARLTPIIPSKLNLLILKLTRLIIENGWVVQCRFNLDCDFSCPSENLRAKDMQWNIEKSLFNHVCRHSQIALYYCTICKTHVEHIRHHKKHLEEPISSSLVDFFGPGQELLIAIFLRCFPSMKTEMDSLKTVKSESDADLKLPKNALKAYVRRDGCFRKDLPNLDKTKGVPARGIQSAFAPGITKLLSKKVKSTLLFGATPKCQFGSGCTQTWGDKKVLLNAQVFCGLMKRIQIHVLRHYGETLYYCKVCKSWLYDGYSHKSQLHKHLKLEEVVVDFFDARRPEIGRTLMQCFPILED